MSVKTVAHLNFRGNAREALAFYESVFAGEATVVPYRAFGEVEDPGQADQVIWGQVVSQSGFQIMAYDVQTAKPWNPGENAFYVSVRGETVEEITAYWERLLQGGSVVQALGPAAWSPLYGMVRDRFGVTWVLDVVTGPAAS